MLTALLTAFYMSRQVFLTFFGRYRYADARPEELQAAWDAKVAVARTTAESARAAAAKAAEAVGVARADLEAATGDDRAAAEKAADDAQRISAAKALEATEAQKAATAIAMKAAQVQTSGVSLAVAPDTADVDAELGSDVAHRREFHPHEAGWHMRVPLVVLAGLAAVGGLLNLPFSRDVKFLETWLEPVFAHPHELDTTGGTLFVLAAIAVLVGLAGIAAAYAVYLQGKADPDRIELSIFADGWKYDTSVAAFMGGPGRQIFEGAATADRLGVDGAVNGVATVVSKTSGGMRRLQNGLVRSYAVGIAFGAVALMVYFFLMAKVG
jgi:NADH-quinone oxidoreductase subunit L